MTDEEIIRWFRSVDPSTSKPQSYSELASKKIPQFIKDDMDRAYISGVMDCADMFLSMYRKGYVRATETHNVLMGWVRRKDGMRTGLLQDEHESIPSWHELRKKIIARCNGRCTMCGCKNDLEVHHIVPVSSGGVMNKENLTAVCFACHRERKNEATDKNPAIHHKRSA
jgi:5-methylcytosine-specific restriction endonuclease McrA